MALAITLGLCGSALPPNTAWADDDEEEEEEEPGDDEKGSEGDDEEEEDDDERGQPPVTAGGLFTLTTYPQRESLRPLTMTEKILQARVAIGTDLSAKGAFDTMGVNLEGVYGLQDNFSLIGGFTNAYNMVQFGFYAGFEGALAYDLVNIRLAANVHRNAIPRYSVFCNPPLMPGEVVVDDGTEQGSCGNDGMELATRDNLPNGNYGKGGVKYSLDIGFPFRYAFRQQFALIALHTLMSIDFNSVAQDYVEVQTIEGGGTGGLPTSRTIPRGNGAKPDLNPSVGILANPLSVLSLVIFAQLRIPDFDTSAGAFQVPVTGRISFSPNQKYDIGLEFVLLNVKPPEGQSPIDNRFLSLFLQARVGR